MAGDTHFDKVSTLLHFDGADASTAITDSSGTPKTFVAYGAANLTTAKSKYGGASLDLSSGGYVQCDASSDFAFGTGDFTIESWVWKSANGAGGYDTVCTTDTSNGSATNGWILDLSTSRGFAFVANGALLASYSSAAPNDSTWHHWAVTRADTTLRLFKDGAVVATASDSSNLMADGAFGVGQSSTLTSYPFNGYIDGLRITKGVARYTAAFTPPPEAFPDFLPAYALSGVIRDASGALAARVVVAHREDTNAFVGAATSDGTTGAYSIAAASASAHTLTAYPASGEALPALVLRGVIPV